MPQCGVQMTKSRDIACVRVHCKCMSTLKKTSTEGRAELLSMGSLFLCNVEWGTSHTTVQREQQPDVERLPPAARTQQQCGLKRSVHRNARRHITLRVCGIHPVLCAVLSEQQFRVGGHHNGAGHHPTEQTEQPPRLRCTRVRSIAPARVAVAACYLVVVVCVSLQR